MKKTINFIFTLIVCFLVAFALKNYVFINFIVQGASMEPTLYDSQLAFSDGLFYRIKGIDRFDIVLIDTDYYDAELIVKRVIGLPNEKVEYIGSDLYINDELVEENFIDEETRRLTCLNNSSNLCSGGVTLKDDEYFVMGDNRYRSSDSRHMEIPVTKKMIFSKGVLLIGSCQDVDGGACKGFKFDKIRVVK